MKPPVPAPLVAATVPPTSWTAVAGLVDRPRMPLAQEVGITLVVCLVLLPIGIRVALDRFCPSLKQGWRLAVKLSCIPVLLFIIALGTAHFASRKRIPLSHDGSSGIYQIELPGIWHEPFPSRGLETVRFENILRWNDEMITRLVCENHFLTNMIPATHTIRRANGEVALLLLQMRTGISHAYLDPLSFERVRQLPQCGLYTKDGARYYTRAETDSVLNAFRLARERWDAKLGSLPELLAYFPKGWTDPQIDPGEPGP